MIKVTRLNGTVMHLNADLVATVESHHDTVITLVDGKTWVVAESASEVVQAVTTYRASIIALAERLTAVPAVERSAPAPLEARLHVVRVPDDARGI